MIPKFRAWDKELKMMCDVLKIDFKNKTLFYHHWAHGVSTEIDLNEVELMQSTGLKDNKGVDIYEGDIVRYNRGVSYSVEKFPYSVKYIEGAFVFEHGFIQHNLFKNVKYVTVIGNIYENPELLEDN